MQTDLSSREKSGRIVDMVILLTSGAVAFLLILGPGGQVTTVTMVLSLVCVVLGLLFAEIRALRRQVGRMEELLDDVRFGAGTKRDRDAVDILVRALRVEDPQTRETALRTLRKLCGQDLGSDPDVWEAWWRGSRATFTRATPAAPAPQK